MFTSLKEAVSEAKIKFQETIEEMDEIKRNLTMFLKITKDIINKDHEIAEHQKLDIEQTFANLQHMLEKRKLAIIKQLQDNNLQAANVLNERQNSIDQHVNLAVVQELCLKKMLDSNDPMQILKFKSTLSRNYKDFTEQYKKIDEGYTIARHTFKKDDKDVEQISGIFSKLGEVNSESYTVKIDGIEMLKLDISKQDGVSASTEKTLNHARGYKFSLKQPFELRSIRIKSDYIGQHIGFVINEADVVISNATINSEDSTMKWLTIPMMCEIRNNYSVFVWAPSGNESYTCKPGDCQPRMINQNCSAESKYTLCTPPINVGSKISVGQNVYSIDMILNIEP